MAAYVKKDRPYIGTVLPTDPNKKGQRNALAVTDQNGGACPLLLLMCVPALCVVFPSGNRPPGTELFMLS